MPISVSDQGLSDWVTCPQYAELSDTPEANSPGDRTPGEGNRSGGSVTRAFEVALGNSVALQGHNAWGNARRAWWERLMHALDRVPIAALLLDHHEGSVVGANAHYWRLLEKPQPAGEAEMRGHFELFSDFYQMCDVEGRPLPRSQWPLQCALRGEHFVGRRLIVQHRASGREWLLAHSCLLQEGHPEFALVTMESVAAGKGPGLAAKRAGQQVYILPPETGLSLAESTGEMIERRVLRGDWVPGPVILCSSPAHLRDEDFQSGAQIIWIAFGIQA